MPDREKVIKGLEQFRADLKPFCGSHADWERFDAGLAMLKEQKTEGKWIYGEDETGVDGWHCSECSFFEPWFYEFTDDIDFIRFYGFCPNCGRKMTSYTGKSTKEGQ